MAVFLLRWGAQGAGALRAPEKTGGVRGRARIERRSYGIKSSNEAESNCDTKAKERTARGHVVPKDPIEASRADGLAVLARIRARAIPLLQTAHDLGAPEERRQRIFHQAMPPALQV